MASRWRGTVTVEFTADDPMPPEDARKAVQIALERLLSGAWKPTVIDVARLAGPEVER